MAKIKQTDLDRQCDAILNSACRQVIAMFQTNGYQPSRESAYWTLVHATSTVDLLRAEA